MVSLAVALVAAVISFCGVGGLTIAVGSAALLIGFACFYLNREAGSKRDLIIGIGSMLLGFLVVASSLMFDNMGLMGLRTPEAPEERQVEEFPETNTEYRRPPPTRAKPSLPEPTRPATQNKAAEEP